jgi:type I restriction enzyme R subunit
MFSLTKTTLTPQSRKRLSISMEFRRVEETLVLGLSDPQYLAFGNIGVGDRLASVCQRLIDRDIGVRYEEVGVVEAKPAGHTLTGVEAQSARYADGLPENLPARSRPLLCAYQSDGEQVRFTNNLDPDARSRDIFHFHQPQALVEYARAGEQLRAKLRRMPPLDEGDLWPAQVKAIQRTEESLAHGRPRALVQMATGSGKTFMAANLVYRLIKHANAKRVLFLVDRFLLGRQANGEFTHFKPPDDNRQFGDLHVIQHLRSNRIDPASEVVITTVQRLYSMLRGEEEFDSTNEQGSMFDSATPLCREQPPLKYNPALPVETFDFIVVDECHRSIYGLWRQVLEYFDAFIIGLTATPSKQTVGFFDGNLVMEYGHAAAVADGVNVDFDVYRIETRITKHGSTVPARQYVDRRDRLTRRVRYELLDEDG